MNDIICILQHMDFKSLTMTYGEDISCTCSMERTYVGDDILL